MLSAQTPGITFWNRSIQDFTRQLWRNCLYGAFQSQADFTSPISFTVMREQLLVARRPMGIG
jgi:hypothetical protein